MQNLNDYQPVRLLNDDRAFLSLSLTDWVALLVLLSVTHDLASGLNIPFLDFGVMGIGILVLIPIRSKYRRHIIRDAIGWACISSLQAMRIFINTHRGRNAFTC